MNLNKTKRREFLYFRYIMNYVLKISEDLIHLPWCCCGCLTGFCFLLNTDLLLISFLRSRILKKHDNQKKLKHPEKWKDMCNTKPVWSNLLQLEYGIQIFKISMTWTSWYLRLNRAIPFGLLYSNYFLSDSHALPYSCLCSPTIIGQLPQAQAEISCQLAI